MLIPKKGELFILIYYLTSKYKSQFIATLNSYPI